MSSDNVRRIFNRREAPKPSPKRNPPPPPREPGVNWGQIVATTAVTALVSVAVIGVYQAVTGRVKDKLTPPPPPPAPEPTLELPKTPPHMSRDQETQWVGGLIAPMQQMQHPGANPGAREEQAQQGYPQYAMMPGMYGMQPSAMFPGAPLMVQPLPPMQPAATPAETPAVNVGAPPHLRDDSEAPEWFVGFARKNDRRMARLEEALSDLE